MVGTSITDAVSEILDDMHSVRPALREGLVNYSALARHIMPLVKTRLGLIEVGDDAVIMAIRRYVEKTLVKDVSDKTLQALCKCSLLIREQMVNIHYRRTDKTYAKLIAFETKRVDWGKGEKFYVIQRTEEVSVIVSRKFISDLLKLVDKKEILLVAEDLTLISVTYDFDGFESPGIFRFFVDRLQDINIFGMFSTLSMMSFLVREGDGAKAYERINRGLMQLRNHYKLKFKQERFINED